jgi:hypothetical protein
LQALATLPNSRRPEALGKTGEQLRAVRFVGARAYLVTFRQIDPLYVLDLVDPADPRLVGSLEVAGYSDQLFPMAGELLLGVGREVNAAGRVAALKLALIDVRDPAHPTELQSLVLGGAGSASALDSSRHGINWLTQGSVARIALPVVLASDTGGAWLHGLQRFEVDGTARTLRALSMVGSRAEPYGTSLWQERSLQIGNQAYYLRDGTLTTHDW